MPSSSKTVQKVNYATREFADRIVDADEPWGTAALHKMLTARSVKAQSDFSPRRTPLRILRSIATGNQIFS